MLDYLRFMSTQLLPVGITDCQGPLTTANQLMGYDTLIYLMDDDPAAAHHLMDTVTTTLIAGCAPRRPSSATRMTSASPTSRSYMGGHAGVWLSDDDAR